jgi:XrtN system VIT domain protein
MKTINQLNKGYVIGLALCTISFIIYLLGSRQNDEFNFFSQTFFLNYGISFAYMLMLFLSKENRENPKDNIPYSCRINFVILLTISAFSLNREMNVFAQFPTWLNVYTVLSIPLFLVYPYFKNFPKWLKSIVLILTGSSLTLSIYMFLYLVPLLPLSCIGLLAIGISIHGFIPAFWLWVLFDFIFKRTEKDNKRIFIVFGALLPLAFLSFYLYKWQKLQVEIKDTIAEQNIKLSNQLPDNIYLAQRLPADALTEEILVAAFKAQRFWDDGIGLDKEGAHKYHNPLSIIALGLFGDVDLSESTVESILNIRKNYRHNTTRKLWTGISLSTSAISTNIQVFPEYRMAYHEKIITIHNDPAKQNRNSWFTSQTQEALYTFHLPEGSIVTSLSLWINGKEEKSRLSTVQKADSAYTKIVGVERRDPAVVHWKEGNKVTVNIFPCTPNEDRKFKIGFTTPLKFNGTEMSLENIWFEGPEFKDAREVTQLIMNNGTINKISDEFVIQANGNYIRKGEYLPHWQVWLNKSALSTNSFCFGGYKYGLEEAVSEQDSVTVKEVFLDITNQWAKEEFESFTSNLNSKKFYAWLPEKTRITKENKNLVWETAKKNQFSIPFIYDVTRPETSIIITKTSYQSPILSDLKQSSVSERFTSYLADTKQRLNVINIGTELSPFWRSLRELRLINYNQCNKASAINKIVDGRLDYCSEDTSKIVISDSHLAITKTPIVNSLVRGEAPDHLLRVFAYNDLLRKIGRNYFEKEKYEDDLFREAEEAYVVSPVTSMIVLESEADYARMGIDKNKNTVGNAGVLGGGAVPEPHEWLLIGMLALFIISYLYKQKQLSIR